MHCSIYAASTAAVMTAVAFDSVHAHGYVSKPAAQFIDPASSTTYVKTITADVNSAFGGLKWDDSPEANTATFKSSFANTGYKSLRDMLDQQVPGCANTRTDIAPVDVAGLTVMNWQNDKEHKGFIDSHHGPCETWIDDTMVDRQEDCVATYGSGYPASINVDFSRCSGACTLRFYWLALHEINWQVYKQCVPISNNSGAQSQSQVQGTVVPADIKPDTPVPDTPAPAMGIESQHGCQNRTLRAVDDPPTHLANGAEIEWTDSRFLREFDEFATNYQMRN
uniref:Secreted protein n=1 Tax=Peronospora matthiolae TaxID=2874970 RepID=A0AAV1VBI7_9STRA